jgi:hypothetical protein
MYNPEMREVLSILGIAYASLCIWLTVQFINRREKRWIALWAAVAVPMLYILCIGPMNWIAFWVSTPESVDTVFAVLDDFYYPLDLATDYAPGWLQDLLFWWINLGVPDIPPHNIGLYSQR